MDELLKMWKEDKMNSIQNQKTDLDGKIAYFQNMIDNGNIQIKEFERQKAELEAVLQKLLSF